MKVYVTGPLRGLNEYQTAKNRHNLSRACRRILITENIPVCPILSAENWDKDPRLPSDDKWWVDNFYVDFIQICQEFVYIPELIGMKCARVEREKNIWRTLGNGRFISADVIIKYLLGYIYE